MEDAMEKALAVFLAIMTVILWGAIIQYHRSIEPFGLLGDKVGLQKITEQLSCKT